MQIIEVNMLNSNFKSPSILFVVVLYRCKIEECLTYKSLLHELNHEDIFVYDNSPFKQNTNLKVGEYISDTSNSGLSVAYNTAAEYARQKGYEWLLLLDQDTTFPKGAYNEYLRAIRQNPDIHMIVPKHKISTGMFISPTKFNNYVSREQERVLDGVVSFVDACPINSGILVDLISFVSAGGYAPAVYLDFSDICFIKKYEKYFREFYVLPSVTCFQQYSVEELDFDKTLSRYKIWLDCVLNISFDMRREKMDTLMFVLRRTISLCKSFRSLKFIEFFLSQLNRMF